MEESEAEVFCYDIDIQEMGVALEVTGIVCVAHL